MIKLEKKPRGSNKIIYFAMSRKNSLSRALIHDLHET